MVNKSDVRAHISEFKDQIRNTRDKNIMPITKQRDIGQDQDKIVITIVISMKLQQVKPFLSSKNRSLRGNPGQELLESSKIITILFIFGQL